MTNRCLPVQQVVKLLTETPTQIAALTDGLPGDQLRATPNDGGWSANEVLAHLRSCADVWGNCIVAILVRDRPTLHAVNPTTWINKTTYRELDFRTSFAAFVTQRADLLAVLEPLAPQSWRRAALVTGAGKPLERTVHSYAQWLATHERTHVKQIKRIADGLHSWGQAIGQVGDTGRG
jgi:hypothetical protein